MDGVNGKGKDLKLYVIGATNKPWSLDWPFLRRFKNESMFHYQQLRQDKDLFELYTEPLKKIPNSNHNFLQKSLKDTVQVTSKMSVNLHN